MRLERAAALASLIAFLAVPSFALKTEVFAAHGTGVAAASSNGILVTAGQALVHLSSTTLPAAIDAPLAALGLKRGVALGGGWHLITWDTTDAVSGTLTKLQAIAGIDNVEPSHAYKIKAVPNDPLISSQYALNAVRAYNAWDLDTGYNSRVTIAVVDAGVDSSQPDLSAKFTGTVSGQFDPNSGAYSLNNPSTPACDHATHVAGVAAASANNHFEVAGMSWGAQLVSLKVFTDGTCTTSCADASSTVQCATNDPGIIAAINFATGVVNSASYGKIVINMSLGEPATPCGAALQTAITNAVAAGVVLVAAAGNDGNSVNTPGNCSGVIPAGATDSSNQVASFSSRGTELSNNGLVAPGVSVLTTDLGGKTVAATGTSFASPMVAGAAALILSANPATTPANVQSYLRAGATNLGVSSNIQGAGLLNAYDAVYRALHGGAAPPSTPAAPSVTDAGLPKAYAFPNPFRLSQTSNALFFVPPNIGASGMTIRVYTMDGSIVRELSAPVWDGKNNQGNFVATGSYIFVATNGSNSARGRFSVIR